MTYAYRYERALAHPAWFGSLATLALNDHVLKGSGLAPGWFTGKLSDFAGLFVAPLLLAVVLRVRSRRGWLAVHLAVGVVFAALQLSWDAARSWSALLGLLGIRWTTTCDPVDLLALPMLIVSWSVLDATANGHRKLSRALEYLGLAAGLTCCVATSMGGPPLVEARIVVHNADEQPLVVRIRQLLDDAIVDCDVAEEDPARYLPKGLFGRSEAWTLGVEALVRLDRQSRPGSEPSLQSTAGTACSAAWVEVDSLPPQIVFWRTGQFIEQEVDAFGRPTSIPWVSFDYDADNRPSVSASDDIVFEHQAGSDFETGSECLPSADSVRLAWSELSRSTVVLEHVDVGADGCVSMILREVPQATSDDLQWTMCVPQGAFPFVAGDVLNVDESLDVGENGNAVVIAAESGAAMWAYRGVGSGRVGEFRGFVQTDGSCGYVVEEACATVRTRGTLMLERNGATVAKLPVSGNFADEGPAVFESQGRTLQAWRVHASRVVIAPSPRSGCPERPAGDNVDFVIVATD